MKKYVYDVDAHLLSMDTYGNNIYKVEGGEYVFSLYSIWESGNVVAHYYKDGWESLADYELRVIHPEDDGFTLVRVIG